MRCSLDQFLQYAPRSRFVPDRQRYSGKYGTDWDCGRVRFFIDCIKANKRLRPIEVDNECAHGAILPRPIVLDGHHRLVAARALQVPLIAVHYGGRIDVLDYLTGKTDKAPE